MRGKPKPGRDAHREAHGGNGAGRLVQGGRKGHAVPLANGHGARQKQPGIQCHQRGRVAQHHRRKAPRKHLNAVALAQHRGHAQHQHGKAGGFEAARRRPRRAAHQHRQRAQHQRRAGKGRLVNGVEARRARGDRLKQRRQHPFPGRKPRPLRVGKLYKIQIGRGQHNQQAACHQHQLCLQAVAAKVQAVLQQIVPHKKADAANGNQRHDGDVHKGVGAVVHQRGKGPAFAHQIEPGVAKGRHRVEHRKPQPLAKPELGAKAQRQHHGARALYQQGAAHNKAHQPHHAAHVRGRHGFLHHHALLQANAPAGDGENGQRHGYHAHAANLNQRQHHRLPKGRPVGVGVLHHKARHAGGAGGGEQRVFKAGAQAVARRDGQRQKQRAEQNQRQKAENNDARGRKPPRFQNQTAQQVFLLSFQQHAPCRKMRMASRTNLCIFFGRNVQTGRCCLILYPFCGKVQEGK